MTITRCCGRDHGITRKGKCLKDVFPLLCEDAGVVSMLAAEFGDRHLDIIRRAKAGEELPKEDSLAYDIVDDSILNTWEIVKEYTTEGGYGEYSIDVHIFSGIFYVTAAEHDPVGYFTSLEDACDDVESNWGDLLK